MAKRTTITCTNCGAATAVPADGDHRALWEQGWRWIGSQDLFSCPPCPPVIVVTKDGRHQRGPGSQAVIPA